MRRTLSIVTGGLGFIGSHLVDKLVSQKRTDRVLIIDNLSEGQLRYRNPDAELMVADITERYFIQNVMKYLEAEQYDVQCVYHTAAISRTPPAVNDPVKCMRVNVTGSTNVLELSRLVSAKRVVLSSSNVVYAADTAYKASKLSMEMIGEVYNFMYGSSVISLRYSNVYGPRLKKGDLGVFAQLRDRHERDGYCEITGDGEQSRDFTHVEDIVRGNLYASDVSYRGVIDLCTGTNWTINEVVSFLEFNPRYVPDRPGDVKHIHQQPGESARILGWKAEIYLPGRIRDIFLDA